MLKLKFLDSNYPYSESPFIVPVCQNAKIHSNTTISNLIKEAKNHLKEKGRLLIGFSTTLGKFNLLKKFTDEANFDLKLIYEVESEEVHPVKFQIYEAKLKI